MTQNNPFNDSDIQSLAADTIGVGGTDGIWQYGSSWLLHEQPFLDTNDDKQLQGLVGLPGRLRGRVDDALGLLQL